MRVQVQFLAGLTAALLASTAHGADLMVMDDLTVIEEDHAKFVLTVGGGIAAYGLPAFSSAAIDVGDDAFDLGLDDIAYGGLIGANMSVQLGVDNGVATSLGASGFISYAARGATSTIALENDSSLFIRGLTTPTGTIDLAVVPGTSTDFDISGTVGGEWDQDGTLLQASGGSNAWGVASPSDDGFSYMGGAVTDTPDDEAFAFGAIATGEGGVFLAIGDLEGWEVETDVQQQLLYTGGDITFALTRLPEPGDKYALTGYAGPSYRFLGQDMTTDISVTPGALEPVSVEPFEYPTYSQSTEEMLSTHYMGGILGGNITMPVGQTSTLTFGLEGGLYYMMTDYDASESYSITGGAFDDEDVAQDQTVENMIDFGGDDEDYAFALRGQATYSMPVKENVQFSLGLGGEYLSKVAQVGRDDTVLTSPSGGTYDEPSGSASNGIISYGDMWSFTLTGAITGQF